MFAVSASSATRVAVSARVGPVKAQRSVTAAAFATPSTAAAARSTVKLGAPRGTTALKASAAGSVATRASARAGGKLAVFAGRFETERTYIMIKPDGVQRGYVSRSDCTPNPPTCSHVCVTVHKRKSRLVPFTRNVGLVVFII